MKPFMDEDFLLQTEAARRLYHDYAEGQPIIDYHCHVSPQEIYENRRFDSITQAWLGGDHYKWRMMRACGVDEALVTGEGDDWDKFLAYARCLPLAIGNPLYHWTHLELKRFFGYDGVLNGDTAREVFDLCNAALQREDMRVRGLITASKVYALGTTDAPGDTLEWHKKLAADPSFPVKVLPSFRPDKVVNIDKADFVPAVEKLCGEFSTLEDLKAALLASLDLFASLGCRASDHGLDAIPFAPCTDEQAAQIYKAALEGHALTREHADGYKTNLLLFLGRALRKRDMVMQLHYNAQRNLNPPMFTKLGPDTGYDAIADSHCGRPLAQLLGALENEGALPRTILYSLNPNDSAMLEAVGGSFQGEGLCKVQHGSAWWFNDTKTGMEAQLTSLANVGVLGGFIGMLTDSRSFLSYTRHEYFRRILCNLIGGWVDNGEVYPDFDSLGAVVKGIAFDNAKAYFRL